jgi:predicted NBD/HSP70 family sugar kinase
MYIAVDIGGTKTLICELDKQGALISKVRFETPKEYSEFISVFQKTFQGIKLEAKPKICVVGAPGKIDRVHGIGVSFGNLGWKNVPLAKDIGAIVGVPVRIENDANLAGLSEAILLKNHYTRVLYITVSTGIGAGLITGGKILPQDADIEVGSMLFEHHGKLQRWEDFASGKAIVKKFGKPASELNDPQAWYVISHNIAVGLFDLLATLTPDAVVIGGGVGSHFDKFKDRLLEDLRVYANEVVNLPPVLPAKRAEEAVIFGCYELGKQESA